MTYRKDPPTSYLTNYLNQLRDQAEVIERCAICGWNEWFSTAAEGRLAAEEHRRTIHRRRKGAKKGRRKR